MNRQENSQVNTNTHRFVEKQRYIAFIEKFEKYFRDRS
jgi:hypothetical protein